MGLSFLTLRIEVARKEEGEEKDPTNDCFAPDFSAGGKGSAAVGAGGGPRGATPEDP